MIKKIAHYITVLAIFAIPIFPLIVINEYFFPFITGKAFYFRILVEIAFAGWAILAYLDPKYRPKLSPITLVVTLFAVVTLLADLLGVNPIRSLWSNFERMEGWITIVHLWALYIVMTSFFGHTGEDRKMWHRWINMTLAVAFIVGLYGLSQFFGLSATHQGATRIDASLGNSAYMGIYMLMHVFLAAYMFIVARKKHIGFSEFLVWAYGILTLLFAFLVFETQTRGSILGLVGGTMLALACYAVFAKKQAVKPRAIAGGIVGFIVLLIVIFIFIRHEPYIERHRVLGRFSNISWNEASNQARQFVWPMAIKGSMERPILGWGQENFNYVFNANYNPKMYSQEQWFDRAHGVFLDWLVAGGIVGLLTYLSLYALFLIAIWKSNLGVVEKSILTGLLAGYFVHNFFVFDNLASYYLFFALLGFANAFHSIKTKTANQTLFGSRPGRIDAAEYVVAPIAVVLMVGIVYYVNVRPMKANAGLIDALQSCNPASVSVDAFKKSLNINAFVGLQESREQILSCATNVINSPQASAATKQAMFELASKAIADQLASSPKDARSFTLAGAFLNGIGQYSQAVSILEKGHALSPKKQTLSLELATDYLNLGQNDKALVLLKEVYESETSFQQAKNAYAIALVIAGKEAEAKKLFGDDPLVFGSTQMAQAYINTKQWDKAIAIYRKIVADNPKDVNGKIQLAQIQFQGGYVSQAIATLREVAKDNPELKDQIEVAIKSIQQ